MKVDDFSEYFDWSTWKNCFSALEFSALDAVKVVLDTSKSAYDAVNMVVNHLMILDRANKLTLALKAMKPYCSGNLLIAINDILVSLNGAYLRILTSSVKLTGNTLAMSTLSILVSGILDNTKLGLFLKIRDLGGILLNALNNSKEVKKTARRYRSDRRI